MLLKDYLKQLENTSFEEPKKVFTMYLNTDPRDPEQQKGKWEIKLKNALDDLQEQTKYSAYHEEKNQAKEMREKIEKEVYGKKDQLHRGLIFFGTADEELWFSQTLNIPVETQFNWANEPYTDQLRKIVEQYPYSGVLVIQQERAQLIETEAGMVLNTKYYQLDMDTGEWNEHEGPQGEGWSQGKAKKDKVQDRVEEHQDRWFKNLAETIQKRAKKQGWDNLQLVGEKEEIDHLKDYFDRPIDKMVPSNLMDKDPDNILADVHTSEGE